MDPGDKFDSYKWDFPEHNLTTVYIEGYPYKVNHDNSINRANKLHRIRKFIDNICLNIISDDINIKDDDFGNGLIVFLDTHLEFNRNKDDCIYELDMFTKRLNKYNNISSRYLISEIPHSVSTDLIGINKPKMRYIDNNTKSIGRDKKMRAKYRDIFIKDKLTDSEIIDLIIHEISHTGACHFTWVDDNHKKDFKKFEDFLKQYI